MESRTISYQSAFRGVIDLQFIAIAFFGFFLGGQIVRKGIGKVFILLNL